MRVVLIIDQLDVGGGQKKVIGFLQGFDPARVTASVVCVKGRGPRWDEVAALGVPVTTADGDHARLVAALEGHDIAHVMRWGGSEPAVPAAVRAARVPIAIETNIFGQVDPSTDEPGFACHLFLSEMCADRYRRRVGLAGDPVFHQRHRVLYNPIDVTRHRVPTASERADARRALGLDPDRPVVVRVGRADDRKWRRLLIDMLPRLVAQVPETQVVLVGTTPAIQRQLQRQGMTSRVHQRPVTIDGTQLCQYYDAADVVVSAAEIGESFGTSIGEALAHGAPVVTCSTPWVDNAQLELVQNGVTGYVATHPAIFADAVADLLRSSERRHRLGAAGRALVAERFAVERVSERLTELYEDLHAGRALPERWVPELAELDRFPERYAAALTDLYRPPTTRQAVEARADRELERGRWAVRAMRHARIEDVLAVARAHVHTRTLRKSP